jgi:hypothetical protein
MTPFETVKKLCAFSPADPVEEMSNHFRVPAFEDGRMMWQGVTIYLRSGLWVAQLDDGRSWSDADLNALVDKVLDEAAVWADAD